MTVVKRGDVFLFVFILALAGLGLLFKQGANFWRPAATGMYELEITRAGGLVTAVELPQRSERYVEIDESGRKNTLLIRGSTVVMHAANCRGGDCLKMPALTSPEGMIVCLPNRLIVRIKDKSSVAEEKFDAITY